MEVRPAKVVPPPSTTTSSETDKARRDTGPVAVVKEMANSFSAKTGAPRSRELPPHATRATGAPLQGGQVKAVPQVGARDAPKKVAVAPPVGAVVKAP